MPENPSNNLLFDHIDGFEYFLIFWIPNLSYLSLLQEGITAEFPALGSSHNRPCKNGTLSVGGINMLGNYPVIRY